jgi:hypothetical protein
MKRILILISLMTISLLSAYSQTVSDVAFSQKKNQIEISYNLTGAKFYQYFSVALYVSNNGGITYQGPMTKVTGDAGIDIAGGRNKKITWDVFKEMPDFGGNVKLDVRATVMEKKLKKRFFIGYKGTQTAPFGIVAGMTGKIGFYVSGRMNSNYFEKTTYETDGETVTNYNTTGYYSFLSDNKTQRLSVTAGLQFQVGWKVHLYAGAGFSQYILLWQIQEYDYPDTPKGKQWVKHTGESFSSFEAEAGIMLQLKHFFLSAGAASPGFKWADFAFGAGVVF